eukprot:538847-Pelagomonas_calceolata.AAC.2
MQLAAMLASMLRVRVRARLNAHMVPTLPNSSNLACACGQARCGGGLPVHEDLGQGLLEGGIWLGSQDCRHACAQVQSALRAREGGGVLGRGRGQLVPR